jgi:hypothetical protein
MVTHAVLAEWRHRIVAAISRLDQTGNGSPGETMAARIGRLLYTGVIPRLVASMMRTVMETRNVAEYESRPLSETERRVASQSWLAIQEWADNEGLQL